MTVSHIFGTKPVGIQLRRERGWNLQAFSYATNGLPGRRVTRPGPFGNPFSHARYSRAQQVSMHQCWLEAPDAESLGYTGDCAELLNGLRKTVFAHLHHLRGHNLACFCPVPEDGQRDCCHRAFLIHLSNKPEDMP